MTPPGRRYDQVPWPGTISHFMALKLWKNLEPFINSRSRPVPGSKRPARPKARPDQVKLPRINWAHTQSTQPDLADIRARARSDMQKLMDGVWPFQGAEIPTTPLALVHRWNRHTGRDYLSWGVRTAFDPAAFGVDRTRAQVRFLVGLLALPAVRPLLKQCGTCGAFKLETNVRRNKKGTQRRFCSKECRLRDPARREATARRQKAFRARRFPK